MFVNRITLPINTSTSATTINIPISLQSYPVDQSELIKTKFVDVKVKESINPIVDYEEARFIPVDLSNNQVYELNFRMNFLSGGTYYNTYDFLGFTTDDLKYRRNNFTHSFLQLDFYDSPNPLAKNFLFSTAMYCVITNDMLINIPGNTLGSSSITKNNKIVNNIQNINTTIKVQDPISLPNGVAEGYYLYDYKSDVVNSDKVIYMRASFNNAKTGKSTNFMVSNQQLSIDNLINNLHTQYTLKRLGDTHGFNIQGNNVNISNGVYNIDLYEVNVI